MVGAETESRRVAAMTSVMLMLCLALLTFCANAQASGGSAMGWGFNAYGQLGIGTTAFQVEAPVAVKGLSGATQIAGANHHTLALLTDGTVMAWGENKEGQLGNGSTEPSRVPIPVPGLSGVVAVAAGGRHSLALLADGTVMAWGSNVFRELGRGEPTSPPECIEACGKLPAPVSGLSNVVAIAAGFRYSLALLADGTVMAWGFDAFGETGDGVGTQVGCQCVNRPMRVPGVAGAVAISAGLYEASALLADGTVKDWGGNAHGGLGNGTSDTSGACECLGPVSVRALAGAKAVAAGGYYGMAILASGGAQAWGNNIHGELGNGVMTIGGCECIPSPGPVIRLPAAQALAAGASHSLALLPDGSVASWGLNQYGQLGDGGTGNNSVPRAVAGVGGASGIFAGENNSFALIGPSQSLKVSFAGAGAGVVGTQGILCPPSCEGRYPADQVEVLRAERVGGSSFAGFSGPCKGTAPCQVKMDRDQSVIATFGRPKGTQITKAKINARKGTARFAFTAPGAITGFQCELIAPRVHKARHGAAHTAAKRSKPRFRRCPTPKTYKHLAPGRYAFKVRALDILGADAKPAIKRFAIKP